MKNVTRRAVIAAGASVPTAGLLAACSGDDSGTPTATEAPSIPQGELIGKAADVPVGGCAVFNDAKLVVTQPEAGTFNAFSAVCTHQGCLVRSAAEGDIPCPCHMSFFSPQDGSVVSGPARSPLARVEISVEDGELRAV